MTVCAIEARVVEPPDQGPLWREWIETLPLRITLVKVTSDAGMDGVAVSWLPGPKTAVADAVAEIYGPLLKGQSELGGEATWQQFGRIAYFTGTGLASGAIDTALWDLRGRTLGQPVWQLLGGWRDRVACYGSAPPVRTVEQAVALAEHSKSRSLAGFKLHGRGEPGFDADTAKAVRDALGPGTPLMFDATNGYGLDDALRVGNVLSELGYEWFEAPLPDDDVRGYRVLCQELTVAITPGEVYVRRVAQLAEMLRVGMVDIARVAGDVVGGLTAVVKCGALCNAMGVRLEPRCYGPP